MLSLLQRRILQECYNRKEGQINRGVFLVFYVDKKVAKRDQVNTITKSLERLIDRGLLVGYGMRTPQKWFIRTVRLTAAGKKYWTLWERARQKSLPF